MDDPRNTLELRGVLVGCGAIALSHAQAFAAEGVKFLTFVDPDRDRAEALARTLGIDVSVAAEVSPEVARGAHFAVVCSPPWEHARQTVALLEFGVDVLCEKPLALTVGDVRAMAASAASNARVLGAAMVRRFFGQSEALKEIIASQLLGTPTRLRVRESMFGWPLSRRMVDPGGAPVGTLADSGPHVLDLVHWLFGPLTLESYEDNAAIGEDSFCHLVATAGSVAVEVFLMRRVNVAPRWKVDFAKGSISFNPRTQSQLTVDVNGLSDALVVSRPQDPFRLQTRDFLSAMRGKASPRVSLEDSEATAAIIDACHARRTKNPQSRPQSAAREKILVTGGTGNVGSRLVETLSQRGELSGFRFLVRNFDNASDLCRLGAETVVGDLENAGELGQALKGCTKVLHLGAGPDPGRETTTLAQAARKSGVHRFVHFSTANVWGMEIRPEVELLQEATPLRRTGDTYCDGKAAAEIAIRRFPELNPVVLRPHIVYGPGMRWTFDLANQLEADRLAVLETGGLANLIFVDDLVDCALMMLANDVLGAFFVNDNEPVPWSHYLDSHAIRLGYPIPRRSTAPLGPPRGWLGALQASGRSLQRVVASDSFREFLTEDPVAKATLFRLYLLARGLGPMKKLRHDLQHARSQGKTSEGSPQWLALQLSRARLSSERLKQATGFQAKRSFEQGTGVAIAWLKERGY